MARRDGRCLGHAFLVAGLIVGVLSGMPTPGGENRGDTADTAAGVVHVAKLTYAGVKGSHCFSDHFLKRAASDSAMATHEKFHEVKLAGEAIFAFPMVVMTGEGDFALTEPERASLRAYLERGGFVLASAGCSSPEWQRAFRREIARLFPQQPLQPLELSHPVFHTVFEIKGVKLKKAANAQPLEGLTLGGRLALIFSADGLNDTGHVKGCCCCGGNEVANCIEININVLAYALTH